VRRLAMVVILLVVAGPACTGASASSSTVSETPAASSKDNPMDRLTALAASWFETGASVVYRTTAHVPGQPTTAHLCLRQMFDDDFGEDRTALLRRCSRQGTLRLMWDPPDVWRMDVITPVDRFTLASTDDRTQICRRGICRAIPRDEAIVDAGADVFFHGPRRILDEIGATAVRAVASPEPIAGLGVECFAANGPEVHVEWCFSDKGVLLSFLRGSGASGWESVEASRVT
jgi:hypothetical protein